MDKEKLGEGHFEAINFKCLYLFGKTQTCIVKFKLLCFRIGFQAKATYVLSRESKVLLAGAMAAYRPAESEKPCQYFYFPGKQNHSNWPIHTRAPPTGEAPECPPQFILCFKNNIQSFQTLEEQLS